MVLSEVAVDIVAVEDEARFRDLMQAHHYLGAVPGMGETVRYVAHHRGRWLALAVFSAPALWMRALRRRSQRARFSWKRLERMTEILWSRASIRHPWPDQRFAVNHPR